MKKYTGAENFGISRYVITPGGQVGGRVSKNFTGGAPNLVGARMIRNAVGGKRFYKIRWWKGMWVCFPREWSFKQFKELKREFIEEEVLKY